MLSAVRSIFVQNAGRVSGATSLCFKRDDRGQCQPGFGRLPTLHQDRREDQAGFRHDLQETALDMGLEFAGALTHSRLESAPRGEVQLDHLAFDGVGRSAEHTSELQSLMRISYAVHSLKKKQH